MTIGFVPEVCAPLWHNFVGNSKLSREIKTSKQREFLKNTRESEWNLRFLQCVQVHALQAPTPQLFQQERDLHQKWLFLREIEEAYFRQKSRINWLKEGDLNSTYFYHICQVRANYNAIRSFLLASGVLVTYPMEMSLLAEAHFKSILGPQSYHPPSIVSSSS